MCGLGILDIRRDGLLLALTLETMPRQPTAIENRIENIVTGLTPVIPLLKELADAFDTPFVPAISITTASLIAGVRTIKNKEDCVRLLEDIRVVLYAILDLHIRSETPGNLPPTMLHHIGKFTETLHQIYTFVEGQQERIKMKSLFRHSEMNILFKDCQKGLQDAFMVFKVESGFDFLSDISEQQKKAENMHHELLELISGLSDETSSDQASSMYHNLNDSQLSSESFSIIPSQPKIFHGRDSELQEIAKMLQCQSPRIAILGPGGMGKTSLARAVLHHPEVIGKYEHRLFVSCESAITAIDLVASIGAYLDLKPGSDLTQPVIRSLSAKVAPLLILDNLESTWEPLTSRGGVEELLSLLADIPHLALLITMRGAEHPAKVRWTRPFLPPLKPLSDAAAQQTFLDIADDDNDEMKKLLEFTGNMPLVVDLMAHLVVCDGAASVLARWETEKTSVLSDGYDRRSNLDASINMSLLSPRFTSLPGAMDLLRLLSILPDGLSDLELLQSNLPIKDILACKAVLLRTSLAYNDDKKRLKSLVPIREHVQHFHPVTLSLVKPLQMYFSILLDLYQKYFGTLQTAGSIKQIALNLGNLHQILLQGLKPQNPDLRNSVACAFALNMFSRQTGRGRHALMNHIQPLVQLCGPKLEVLFITEQFRVQFQSTINDPEPLVSQAKSRFQVLNDPVLESQFYSTLGFYYANRNNSKAKAAMDKVVELVNTTEHINTHADMLSYAANFYWISGEYNTGKTIARKAQRLAQLAANLYEEAHALRIEAGCNVFLGEYGSTVFILQRARQLLELCSLSDSPMYYRAMDLEADIHLRKSEYAEARKLHMYIAQKSTAKDNPVDHAYALMGIGEIDAAIGTHGANPDLENARKLFTSLNLQTETFICEAIQVEHELRNNKDLKTTTLKKTLEKCLQWSWTGDPQLTLYSLQRMGDSTLWPSADFRWAATYAFIYLAFASKKQEKLALHKAIRYLGDVFLADNDEKTAESTFIAALDGFTSMDVHRGGQNA
ncbi:ATPase-AAA-core domain-containing protein [Mycena venus]|uniref:ATPase-AAA-core domain-containing protein n=1 Tax=Mycena venus TaxID=2733690 RepID=A0A8H6Y5B4_9AGAR|nr:ATPase-AAA-core domain-containing protein [Mycena venus]